MTKRYILSPTSGWTPDNSPEPHVLTSRDLQVLILGLEAMWRDSDDWADYGDDVVRLMGLLQPLI
jgi:hypothetical protein